MTLSNVRSEQSRGDQAAVEAQFARSAPPSWRANSAPSSSTIACLETHGVVVDYHGGDTATVYASTQGYVLCGR